jgi:hypothetical protein
VTCSMSAAAHLAYQSSHCPGPKMSTRRLPGRARDPARATRIGRHRS